MPLLSDFSEPLGGRLLIWQIREQEIYSPEFMEAASPLLQEKMHPVRRRQRLATCALLQLLGPDTLSGLWYDTHGKPWIRDPEGHISLSHCAKYAGLYFHPKYHVGIDIEEPHERISRVSSRFIHPEKEKWAENDQQLLNIWSAKEAVFKAIGGGGIHFKDDLHVEQPGADGMGVVHYQGYMGNKLFRTSKMDLEGAVLVYTIAEEAGETDL